MIKSYFFNAVSSGGSYDRVYNAEDVTSYLDLLVGNGVFPNPSSMLQVQAGTGMNVIVKAGSGWINGHKMVNTADMTLSIDASDVLLDRIDRIIFYVDLRERDMGITVLKGTPSSSARVPALTRNEQRYEMALASVSVGKQVTAINATMIRDTRGDSSVCGYVQGLIQQMDTSALFRQYDAAFWTWFNEIQEEAASVAAIRKYEAVYTTTTEGEHTFNVKAMIPEYGHILDILEVRINGLTLSSNEYSASGDSVTLTTPIDAIGTPISFVVYKANGDSGSGSGSFEQIWSSPRGVYPLADQVITPSKKLSECANGWALRWTEVGENGAISNDLSQTTYIPKKSHLNAPWNGETTAFSLIVGLDMFTGEPALCTKMFKVTDESITSGRYNALGNATKVVLKSIFEY